MRQWVFHIDTFRHAIWTKLDINNHTNWDRDVTTTQQRSLNIPYESFSFFGFVNDTGFRTTAPDS